MLHILYIFLLPTEQKFEYKIVEFWVFIVIAFPAKRKHPVKENLYKLDINITTEIIPKKY